MNKCDTLLPLVDTIFQHLLKSARQFSESGITDARQESFLQDILSFHHILLEEWFQDTLRNPDFIRNNAQTFTSLYNAFNDFIMLVDNFTFSAPHKEMITLGLGTIGIGIYATSAFLIPTRLTLLPSYVPLSRKLRKDNTDHSFGMLLTDIISLRNQRKCARSSCGETGEDTRTNFKICAACEGVRYCSKACQVLDWKEDHKPICKFLKILVPLAKSYDVKQAHAPTPEGTRHIDAQLKKMVDLSEEDILLTRQYVSQHTRLSTEEIMGPFIRDAIFQDLFGLIALNQYKQHIEALGL